MSWYFQAWLTPFFQSLHCKLSWLPVHKPWALCDPKALPLSWTEGPHALHRLRTECMVWGGGGGRHLKSALTETLIAGSIRKHKVGTRKGLHLHKGLDSCHKKGVIFSLLETPAFDFPLYWGMKNHVQHSQKIIWWSYGKGTTAGLFPAAPGCPSPDFSICASLACPDLAILFLFSFFPSCCACLTGFNPGVKCCGIL